MRDDAEISRVIILGIDGLDPNILESLMDNHELPAFSSIKLQGGYRRLATSNPPQSPVAWSTMATGNNPGYHGIFDFITRNPANYLPLHSIVKANPKNLFAQRNSMFLHTRGGTPFWTITSKEGIPTTVVRWPVTFPPEEINGNMLSGLGVLDLKSTMGRYTLYTTRHVIENSDRKGDIIQLSAESEPIKAVVKGPNNSQVPMDIKTDKNHSTVAVTVCGGSYTISAGEWSDWIQFRFNVGPLRHISGMSRLCLVSIQPDVELLMLPVQVAPQAPAFLISYPDNYVTELAGKIGNFSTLGQPEETNALIDGCFCDDIFLDLCDKIMAEREKMLWYELERFRDGLLAFVFDTTDRIQHIYWNTCDPEHPFYDVEHARKYRNVIEDYYRRMDKILEHVLEFVDQRTVICILSDHGFTSFRRAVHLNSLLVQSGLMALKKPAEDYQGDPLFSNVIWQDTKAYALGFSSIYLNLRGREGKGIVNSGDEAERLKTKIADVFTNLKDPKTGKSVIKNVYRREEIYHGPYISDAPDLIVGFESGYRASWQTAIGGAPPQILEDNLKKWSGDHIMDAQVVPGIFFMNRNISASQARGIDIAPTILDCFQIPKPADVEGNTLLE